MEGNEGFVTEVIMDAAVRRLERTAAELWQKRNTLRQEEISEEIEVIMLSVQALG